MGISGAEGESMSSQPSEWPTFNVPEVDAAIAGTEFHGWLMNFPTVPSTNGLAAEAAQVGARHGVWIADEQTAGRGRGGHTWHSAPGEGLYMTALISPPIPTQSALRFSFRTAIAVQSAIASTFGFRIREDIDIPYPELDITRVITKSTLPLQAQNRSSQTSQPQKWLP